MTTIDYLVRIECQQNFTSFSPSKSNRSPSNRKQFPRSFGRHETIARPWNVVLAITHHVLIHHFRKTMWRRTGHARSGLWIVGHIATRLSNHFNKRVERTWGASAVDDKRCQKLNRIDAYNSAPNAIIPNYIYTKQLTTVCEMELNFFRGICQFVGPFTGQRRRRVHLPMFQNTPILPYTILPILLLFMLRTN